MRFRVVGYGDLPEEKYKDGWWTEILKSDSIIPPVALPAVKVLKDAKIPITGMYLRHEAPKLLMAPKPLEKPKTEFPTKTVVGAVGAVLGLLAIAGTILVWMFILVAQADPQLIVVLPDGTHLEVATWLDFTSPSDSYKS
jgi:hypothetical protein